MKMKTIRILAAMASAVILSSCVQELEGVKSSFNDDDNREIHFVQGSIIKSFDQGTLDGEFTVTLGRLGNKGTYKVQLAISGKDAQLFSFEPVVTIPDGQYSVDIPVYVDMSHVMLGSEVTATMNIEGRDAQLGDNPAFISQYSDFLKLNASFKLEWEPYMRTTEDGQTIQQTATYLYNQFYQGAQGGMLVEKAKGSDNVFRLLDWAAGVGFVFMINKDNSVKVPAQSIGYYYEDVREYVYVSDVAQYLGMTPTISPIPAPSTEIRPLCSIWSIMFLKAHSESVRRLSSLPETTMRILSYGQSIWVMAVSNSL